MDTPGSDLVEWYKLEAKIFKGGVRHKTYVKEGNNGHRMVEEDWDDCGELGHGAFGEVYKQVSRTTGNHRAIKRVVKKRLRSSLNYSRELLIMGILAKVCVLVSRRVFPQFTIHLRFPCYSLTFSCLSTRYCLFSSWDGSINPKLSISQWNIFPKAISPSTLAHHYNRRPFKPFQSRYSRVSK